MLRNVVMGEAPPLSRHSSPSSMGRGGLLTSFGEEGAYMEELLAVPPRYMELVEDPSQLEGLRGGVSLVRTHPTPRPSTMDPILLWLRVRKALEPPNPKHQTPKP